MWMAKDSMWFHLLEVPRVVRFIETESRMGVTRGTKHLFLFLKPRLYRFKLFVYLAVWGLSCDMCDLHGATQDLSIWCTDSNCGAWA